MKLPQRRLPPDERKQLIINGSVEYFAEVGFDGQTRELAARLGITNPLLFRYFPTKDELIEAVYEHVYSRRWDPAWEAGLRDRAVPLQERLRRYYHSYLSVAFSYQWTRIFFFAALKGVNIKDRYLQMVEARVITVICVEVRHHCGMPTLEQLPITAEERDAIWSMHGQMIYTCIRKFVYNQPVDDPYRIADGCVRVFLDGIDSYLRQIVAAHKDREATAS